MSDGIRTGYVPRGLGAVQQHSSPDSVATTLFNSESRSIETRPVFIPPGKGIVVDAYGMQNSDKFYLFRTLRGSFDPANGSGCPPCAATGNVPTGTEMMRKPVWFNRQEWVIDGLGNDILIITLPGAYVFEASTLDMTDRAVLVYTPFTIAETNFPAEYLAGVTKLMEA